MTGDTMLALADGGRASAPALARRPDHGLLALNPDTWRLERHAVVAVVPAGTAMVARLTTRLGRSIRASAGHEFLTLGGWRRLDELRPGDHVALPRELPAAPRRSMLDDEVALLGRMIGGGRARDDRPPMFATPSDLAAAHVCALVWRLFGEAMRPRMRTCDDDAGYCVNLTAAEPLPYGRINPLVAWLRSLGAYGLAVEEQRVPEPVFAQPIGTIAHFLRHLPHEHEGEHPAAWTTPSRQFAADVQSLLLRIGISGLISGPAGSLRVQVTAPPDRERLGRLLAGHDSALPAADFGDDTDVYWDGVRDIAPAGTAELFDVAVAGDRAVVAGDVMVAGAAA